MDEKRKRALAILVSVLILASAALFFVIFRPVTCDDYGCFESNMVKCKPTSYINEETGATWGYVIKGQEAGECDIEVELLLAKEGSLGIDEFEGHKMICSYPLGVPAFPDKDLSLCSGELKEDLQGLIIKKLHTYIVDNIGELD